MKPHGYWTTRRVAKEAKKYPTKVAFQRGSNGAYDYAWRNGLLEDICKHMISGHSLVERMWTVDNIPEEASRYIRRTDFKVGSRGAYATAVRLGILEDVCRHMKTPRVRGRTIRQCMKLAAGYATRAEFRYAHSAAYDHLAQRKQLDKAFKNHLNKGYSCDYHLTALRYVYVVYKFVRSKIHVYVGLTVSITSRLGSHIRHNSKCGKLLKKGGRVLQYGPYSAEEAQKLEKRKIMRFRNDDKFKVLNVVNGGALGGYPWTNRRTT